MLGNAEIGHDTQYFPQNGFSVSGKPPAGKLDRDAEYRYFYGQPDEGEIIALAAKVGLTAGDLEQISDRIVRRHGETGSIFAPAAVRLRPCLAGRAVRRFGSRFARYFGRHAGGKNRAAGHGVYAGNARPLRSRTPEP